MIIFFKFPYYGISTYISVIFPCIFVVFSKSTSACCCRHAY